MLHHGLWGAVLHQDSLWFPCYFFILYFFLLNIPSFLMLPFLVFLSFKVDWNKLIFFSHTCAEEIKSSHLFIYYIFSCLIMIFLLFLMRSFFFHLLSPFQERDAYLPLAESASKMYFVITDLSRINNMYRFSLAAFLRLFQRALQAKKVTFSNYSQCTALKFPSFHLQPTMESHSTNSKIEICTNEWGLTSAWCVPNRKVPSTKK